MAAQYSIRILHECGTSLELMGTGILMMSIVGLLLIEVIAIFTYANIFIEGH